MKILSVCRHTPFMYMQATLLPEYSFDLVEKWNSSQRPMPENCRQSSVRQAVKALIVGKYKAAVFSLQFHHYPWIILCILCRVHPVLVTHAKLKRRGVSTTWYRWVKFAFNRMFIAPLVLSRQLTLVYIQPAIREEYGLPGYVIEPGMLEFNRSGSRNFSALKVCIVGNDLQREHFDRKMLRCLEDLDNIDVIGTGIPGRASPSVNFEDYLNRLSDCNIYLNLLDYPEAGYNLATLEASSLGLLIISKPSNEAVVFEGFNGYVVRDADELQSALLKIAEDPVLSARLAEKNREFMAARFAPSVFAQKWQDVFTGLDKQQKRKQG